MLDTLGVPGVLGFLVVVAGLAVIALESLLVAGGLALVLVGLGLVAYGMISNFMRAMGLGF